MSRSRRDFLRETSLGLAFAGASVLTLRSDALPTPASGKPGEAEFLLEEEGRQSVGPPVLKLAGPKGWQPTEDNILGPYFRQGAPYRAKITPPLEPGETLLIRGRVWGADTRKPLHGATLDIWQANAKGRYDNDDSEHPPPAGVYVNRARMLTDETGYYEFESIHPGRYKTGPDTWRPSHIHYLVRCTGYADLVTQLYFKGDPYNATDPYIKPSLIIETETQKNGSQSYSLGTFDIVLAAK
jgi:catechol 1,2-dioxygenase